MADELDALLERVSDDELRSELRHHIERLRRKRQFGLVFESHLPERVRLTDHPIRRGSRVVRQDAPSKETPQVVLQVKGKTALLDAGGETEEVARDELVVVAEFGEPIYPGLSRLVSVNRGGDKRAQVVIKGENYHALEALRFSHAGKIDCIYIDPPYNTGARDWKYDNDYVEDEDHYRHSKWLAFMESRLRLARDLLNPDDSALIVAIDIHELHRLGLLLEQLFTGCPIQMVTSVINPRGRYRDGEFARSDEHLLVVTQGLARVHGEPDEDYSEGKPISWRTLRRSDIESRRGTAKGGMSQFYPIYVNVDRNRIEKIGAPLSHDAPRESAPHRDGCVAVFPIRDNGTEMNWGLTPDSLRNLLAEGFVKLGKATPMKPQAYQISYLTSGRINDIRAKRVEVVDRDDTGAVIAHYVEHKLKMPTTNWQRASHSAEVGGTNLVKALLGDKRFDYPKSLYAVEDMIRYFLAEKHESTVLDFFGGSGTTTHAVMRLNRQDGGRRQSILVTNNEVSGEAAAELSERGLSPGDPEWEALGVFERVTMPRVVAAVTGKTPEGVHIEGEYSFSDAFPIAEGFMENVEFLELKYLDVEDVEIDLAFESIAPLLWLRAGGFGPVIDRRYDYSGAPKSFDLTDRYGVLFDPDHWRGFVEKLSESITTVFVVTDSPSVFASVTAELPSGVGVVRLYENYMSSFAINRGR